MPRGGCKKKTKRWVIGGGGGLLTSAEREQNDREEFGEFAVRLAEAVQSRERSAFQRVRWSAESIKRGWTRTNVGWEEGVQPPLLSLAKFEGVEDAECVQSSKSAAHSAAKDIFDTLFSVIVQTGGVRPILNDRRYAVVATAYRTSPYFLMSKLNGDPEWSNLIDWNIPDYSIGGKTPWMIASELMHPKVIMAMMPLFPAIDVELEDESGNNPSRILQLNGEERGNISRQMARHIKDNRVLSGYWDYSYYLLYAVYNVWLPTYKTGLKTVFRSAVREHDLLPTVLCTIIESFLRL